MAQIHTTRFVQQQVLIGDSRDTHPDKEDRDTGLHRHHAPKLGDLRFQARCLDHLCCLFGRWILIIFSYTNQYLIITITALICTLHSLSLQVGQTEPDPQHQCGGGELQFSSLNVVVIYLIYYLLFGLLRKMIHCRLVTRGGGGTSAFQEFSTATDYTPHPLLWSLEPTETE